MSKELSDLSPYLNRMKKEIAIEFEVAESTVIRWANGVVSPLDRMTALIVNFVNKKNDELYSSYGIVSNTYRDLIKQYDQLGNDFIQENDNVFEYGLDVHIEDMNQSQVEAERIHKEKDDVLKEILYIENRYLKK